MNRQQWKDLLEGIGFLAIIDQLPDEGFFDTESAIQTQ